MVDIDDLGIAWEASVRDPWPVLGENTIPFCSFDLTMRSSVWPMVYPHPWEIRS